MRFLNASVLERKSLNRNLSWGFPLGNLLPKTRVLKHRVLERKRRPNANASVLGTQRFRTLRALSRPIRDYHQGDVGEKKGLLFRKCCVFDVRRPLASHNSNPYRRIPRDNATKIS